MTGPKISLAEPVSALKSIPIVECGESLVNYLEACPLLLHDEPVFDYHRETLLRESVVTRLCRAAEALPKEYRLVVLEGWRGRHIQHRMYLRSLDYWRERHPEWSEAAVRRVANRFTAPINHPKVPPPHSTGGALDIGLRYADGSRCDFHTPFERADPRSFPTDAKGLSREARQHRDLLRSVLREVDITNYPSEYWHFSYGDQGWAYRGGHDHAVYASIEPQGWEPKPEDVGDHPLVRASTSYF